MVNFSELEEKIGYRFVQKNLLRQALTHSSYANEKHMKRFSDNFQRVLISHLSEALGGGPDKIPRQYCLRADAGDLCQGAWPGELFAARQGRTPNRRQKPGFHSLRRHGGADWRNLSGRRF